MSSPLNALMADMNKMHGKPDKPGKDKKDSKNEHKGSKNDQKGSQIPESQKQKGGKTLNGGKGDTSCTSPEGGASTTTSSPQVQAAELSMQKLQASIGALGALIGGFGTKLDSVNQDIKDLKQGQDALESQLVDYEYEGGNEGYPHNGHEPDFESEQQDNSGLSDGELDTGEPPRKQPRPASPAGSDSDCFATLRQECGLAEIKGPPVGEKLAQIVNRLATSGLEEKSVSDRKAKIVDIENTPMLVAPRLNDCVWQVVQKDTRIRDSTIQGIQKAIAKGLNPIVKCADSLQKATKGQDMPDAQEALTQLVDGLSLVLVGHYNLNMLRRDLIKPDLHKDFKSICARTNPISAELFGDELPKRLKDIGDTNRVGAKVGLARANHNRAGGSNGNRPFVRNRSFGFRPQYNTGRGRGYSNFGNNYGSGFYSRPKGRGHFLDAGSSSRGQGRSPARGKKQ